MPQEGKTAKGEWIDGHVHVIDGGIRETEALAAKQAALGYTQSAFLSVEGMGDAAQNALAIYFKLLSPAHYAFGGLHYRFPYDFGREAARLHSIGLDGIKMIENKPTERKKLGYAQNDARYEGLYRTLCKLEMPLLVHVNDPAAFWKKEMIPEWAAASGYYYGDGSYPSYEQILAETVDMVEKYPGMKVCFAHFLFLADAYERLSELMERFPNIRLDITAGTEMYFSFTEKPSLWRAFFLNYQDRILYGTDNCNVCSEEEAYNMAVVNRMEQDFLESSVRFDVWDKQVQGIGLPKEAVRKITVDNFREFAGASPAKLNREEAAVYLYERLSNPAYRLSERERAIIWEVYANCV